MTDERCCMAGVERVLTAAAVSVVPVGARGWLLRLDGADAAGSVMATSVPGWLLLETALPVVGRAAGLGPARVQSLLRQNAALPSPLTYAVGPGAPRLLLTADVPLEDAGCGAGLSDASGDLVRASVDGFRVVLGGGAAAAGASPDPGVRLRVADPAGAALLSLCRETGWLHDERADGQFTFTLDVPGLFCQVQPFVLPGGSIRLRAGLAAPPRLSRVCRRAIGLLLLTASRVVRLARAAAAGGAAEPYVWEVVWPAVPAASLFDRGLTALSIACRMTARELRALCDESIAREYLALRGWSP